MNSKLRTYYICLLFLAPLAFLTSCSNLQMITQTSAVGKNESELSLFINNTAYTFTVSDKEHQKKDIVPAYSQMKIIPGDYTVEGPASSKGELAKSGSICNTTFNSKAGKEYFISAQIDKHIADTYEEGGFSYKYVCSCAVLEK